MRSILFVFLLFLITPSYAQLFAPVGTYWTYGTGEFWIPGSYPTTWTVTRDTMVIGKHSRVIEITQGGGVYWDTTNIIIHGDSSMIQWFDPHNKIFKTFIDFNADSGDIWHTNYPYLWFKKNCPSRILVDSVDSIKIGGHLLRRMLVHIGDSLGYYGSSTIVEHIGFFGSFEGSGIYPGKTSKQACGGGSFSDLKEYYGLRCFEDSALGFIDFISGHDCNYNNVGISDLVSSQKTVIFPNPTDNKLLLSENLINAEIEIFSQTGKRIIHLENFSDSEISVSDLNPGIYFIRITEKGKVKQAKFIKN